MIDTIPGVVTKEKIEKDAEEWQKEQNEFPGPVPPAPPLEDKPPVVHNEFYERQRKKARRQEDYMRQGTPN